MLRKTLWLAIVLCLAWTATSFASSLGIPTKVYPRDETEHDLSFMEYKLRLYKAIETKELSTLLPLISPTVHVSFGGETGHKALISMWKLDNQSTKSSFWSKLEGILKMGAVRQRLDGEPIFVAPYTFPDFPGADDGRALIVTGHSVRLRKTPATNGNVMETLDYDVVHIADSFSYHPDQEWVKIISPKGTEGYVHSSMLRSPLDYRAGFKKIDGEWKMIFFVSGD